MGAGRPGSVPLQWIRIREVVELKNLVPSDTREYHNRRSRVIGRKDSWNDNLVAKVLEIAGTMECKGHVWLEHEDVGMKIVHTVLESLSGFCES